MGSDIFKYYVLLMPLLLLSCASDSSSQQGAASVKSISIEGTAVTVSGVNLGIFSGEVVTWDDFEAQSLGGFIDGSTPKIGIDLTTQFSYKGNGAVWDNGNAHSGTIAAHLNWSVDENTIRAFGWGGNGPFDKLYITYWRYMTGDFGVTALSDYNHKQFFIFGTQPDNFPQMLPLIPSGGSKWGIYNNIGDGSVPFDERNNINTAGWSFDSTKEIFQRWEFWFVINDVNVSNGTVKAWLDGELGIENLAYNSRRVDGLWEDFRLGHQAIGFSDTAKAWFDDLYIATTQQRIEVCNSKEWSNRGQCDIQVVMPEDWTSTKITFQIRGSVLTTTEEMYLYLIDNDGVVINQSGLALQEFIQ